MICQIGKKLITSGSDASLTSLSVDTFISASSFIGDGSGLTGVTSYTDTDTLNFLNSINALSGSALQDAIDTEKARIDAILLSAGADTDSFAEIVSLINSIDTDNDTAFASFYTASNERIGALETFTSSLDTTILNLTGSFTGDGSGLTGISVSEAATVTNDVTATTSTTITHNFDSYNVNVVAYDENRKQVLPESVTLTDENTATVTFCDTFSGTLVASKGGHIVSGSLPVSEQATIAETFTDVSTYTVTHNFDTKNILVFVYDDNDRQILPKFVTTSTNNTVSIEFCENTTGRVVVAKGGHIVSGVSTNGITRTLETYTATEDQTIFPTTASITGENIDVYINGFKLLRSDFSITDSNTITLTSGSSAGEQVEINLYNPFFGTYLLQEDLDGYVTGSVTGSNIVGSDTVNSIETITSASYAAITPVSGTLYIITD